MISRSTMMLPIVATLAAACSPPPPSAPAARVAGATKEHGVDRGAVADALEELQEDASRCGSAGGPVGNGKGVLTFDPQTGSVIDAKVEEPPFAGTGVGACVEHVFHTAKVPPFQGAPLKVAVPFFVAQANGAPGFSVRSARTAAHDALTKCSLKVQQRDVVADELRVHFKQGGGVSQAEFFRSEDHGPIDESEATRCVRKALKETRVPAFSSDEERAAVRVYFTRS